MILRNLLCILDNRAMTIHIHHGRITAIDNSPETVDEQELTFKNAIVFPGLINSHDHLDFNVFPQLGNRLYNNYVEWGDDIHKKNKQVIDNVLKVPKHLRARWGMYKNLLCGVTTVVDHAAIPAENTNDLISVFDQYHYLHSIQLEKRWRFKLNKPFIKKQPFVLHIGEGIDSGAQKEINSVIRWNLQHRDLIGIHGIVMNEHQAKSFKALVWCPVSNKFLIGQTAQVNKLKYKTNILFGTDSTVSASWNIWEHLRLGRSMEMISDKRLFAMTNTLPTEVWKINKRGKIKSGYEADIVIARQKDGLRGYDAFFATNPEDILLIMRKGEIKLFDESLVTQLLNNDIALDDYHKVLVAGSTKYVYGNVPQLISEIKQYYPEAFFPINTELA